MIKIDASGKKKKSDLNYQLTNEPPLTSKVSIIFEKKVIIFDRRFWPVVDHR